MVGRPVAQPCRLGDCLRHRALDGDPCRERCRPTSPRRALVPVSLPGSFSLAIAAGVLVVAYFGLAHQYFALRFGRRSQIYFPLFLFFAWLMPLVAGTIAGIAAMSSGPDSDQASQVLFSLSPVVGIGALAGVGRAGPSSTLIHGAAITPALLFTFAFNSLLVAARRRAYREFLAAAGSTARSMSAARPASQDGDAVPPKRVDQVLDSVGGT